MRARQEDQNLEEETMSIFKTDEFMTLKIEGKYYLVNSLDEWMEISKKDYELIKDIIEATTL